MVAREGASAPRTPQAVDRVPLTGRVALVGLPIKPARAVARVGLPELVAVPSLGPVGPAPAASRAEHRAGPVGPAADPEGQVARGCVPVLRARLGPGWGRASGAARRRHTGLHLVLAAVHTVVGRGAVCHRVAPVGPVVALGDQPAADGLAADGALEAVARTEKNCKRRHRRRTPLPTLLFRKGRSLSNAGLRHKNLLPASTGAPLMSCVSCSPRVRWSRQRCRCRTT